MHIDQEAPKRKAVSLTIRKDIMDIARDLELNASKAAEKGLIEAIRETQSKEWLTSNKNAINAHNQRIEKEGALLSPAWASE